MQITARSMVVQSYSTHVLGKGWGRVVKQQAAIGPNILACHECVVKDRRCKGGKVGHRPLALFVRQGMCNSPL